MNRCDRLRCVFFHVPRTGGSSIESLDWWDEWTGHLPSALEANCPGDYFSFAFVRNPWDRFVSLFHYFATMTPGHRWYPANAELAAQVQRFGSFADFCHTFHGWAYRDNLHFRPQCSWIADGSGRTLVDFVGRFEQLQQDFASVCARLGVARLKLPKLNGSGHRPYRDYYDDETNEIVAALSRRDIAAFGYDF